MTLPTMRLVIDDRAPLSRFAAEFADVERFGALRRSRSTLIEHLAGLGAAAGLPEPLVLPLSDAQLERRLAAGARSATLWLVLPAHLAPQADQADAVRFLQELATLTQPAAIVDGDRPSGALLLSDAEFHEYLALPTGELSAWRTARAGELPAVRDGLKSADLHDPASLLELLSGSFAARHFNELEQGREVITKRSSDGTKLAREYAYYGLLPEQLQPYFVQPFDLEREDGGGASYKMHRLLVPDLGVQWVHRAFGPEQFARLLEQLLRFVDERTERPVEETAGRATAERLYGTKLQDRLDAFLKLPLGGVVDGQLAAAGIAGGVDGLRSRYEALRATLERRRKFDAEAITHGDYCFSNILYNPTARSVHLIDPRGAETEDELFSDPYYDIAKLSHSVLGGYDLIVGGLTLPAFDEELQLSLTTERSADPAIAEQFAAALASRGYDLRLVRLYEASLFLSMLPLHADAPRRVLALALRAGTILDELEAGA